MSVEPERTPPRRPDAEVAWFGIGVGLTTATQLRLSSFPVGPGEALLAAWAVWAWMRLPPERLLPRTRLARALAAFGAVSLAAMLAGRWVAVARGYAPTDGGALHDTLAFLFIAAVMVPFAAAPRLGERAPLAFLWFVAMVVPPLAALAALGDPLSPGPVEVNAWQRGRLRGWAANANQMALALVLIPFVLAAAARRDRRTWRRGMLGAVALLVPGLGWLTGSDALGVAWAGGAGVWILLVWLRAVRQAPAGSWARRVARGGVPALLLLGAAVCGPAAARAVRAHVAAEWAFEGSGTQRAALLRHGLEAWARSPVVGLGPGGHSGYRAPFQGEEAHNTLVDWGVSTGVVGAAALVVLLAFFAARVVRARDPLATAGLAALLAYACFHYVMRQPVFWLGLATVLALAEVGAREGEGADG